MPTKYRRSQRRPKTCRPLQLVAIGTSLVAAGCATIDVQDTIEPLDKKRSTMGARECLQLYRTFDQQVSEQHVQNFGPAKIPGFPYLRADRFLASFKQQPLSDAELSFWLTLMSSLDLQSRVIEYSNLTAEAQQRVANGGESNRYVFERLRACSEQLSVIDQLNPDATSQLRDLIRVPADYSDRARIPGIYDLTAAMIQPGIAQWHADTAETFNTPNSLWQPSGEVVRYGPTSATPRENISAMVRYAPQNPLDIPLPDKKTLGALFQFHAPIWEIDTTSDADRIGEPFWWGENQVEVDHDKITVYTYPSHTRFRGRSRLQLNYVIWFSERPKEGLFDLLGGRLDGLTWRVTLDDTGTPILHDAIHNCGCYHMFFPSPYLTPKAHMPDNIEQPLILRVPLNPMVGRTVVRLSTGDHQILRVYTEDANDASTAQYALASYDQLLSLPYRDDERKSMFDTEGFVPRTQRGERFLFWPTGVVNAGAMRQRGHHATAFIGERHFDDAYLLDGLFEWIGTATEQTSPITDH